MRDIVFGIYFIVHEGLKYIYLLILRDTIDYEEFSYFFVLAIFSASLSAQVIIRQKKTTSTQTTKKQTTASKKTTTAKANTLKTATTVSKQKVTVSRVHSYVDLGLPSGTLWATCNLGADNPEDYGDYYAWGETSPKKWYDWETYRWCNGSETTLTKYCTSYTYGMVVDNKAELDLLTQPASIGRVHSVWTTCMRLTTSISLRATWVVMPAVTVASFVSTF